MKHIHSYYSPNDLYNKIIDGLNNLGKDLSEVTLNDFQPVDEFHIRGDVALNFRILRQTCKSWMLAAAWVDLRDVCHMKPVVV